MKLLLLSLSLVFFLALLNLAKSQSPAQFYEQAWFYWKNRSQPEQAKKALELFKKSAEQAKTNEDYWVQLSFAYFWLGEITPQKQKKERIEYYEKGEASALKAIELNPQSVGGNFWAVVNNGRATQLRGVLSGTFNLGLCLKNMTIVAIQDPEYYYGGVYRFWGRFIYEIPSIGRRIARFRLEDSVYFYRRSLEVEPNFFMTRVYLAETYLALGERKKAYQELVWVLSHPADILPEAEPENLLEQKHAWELLVREFGEESLKKIKKEGGKWQ